MDEKFLPASRRRLVLKPGKERLVANRHPWVFAGAVQRESGPGDAAFADLVDPRGRVVASGFHSVHSQIRLRVLTFDGEPLTEDSLRARVLRAAAARAPLLTEATNAVRLIHAEGDDLSGLVVDRYDDILVVEVANAGLESVISRILPSSGDGLGSVAPLRGTFFKNDLPARKREQLPLDDRWVGEGEPVATILENGLRFRVEPAEGQKTGFFLDQRENRDLARKLARGLRVLNLFSYSGAFGVYAAAGGAAAVENVDVSARAIQLGRTNHELNGQRHATFVEADAFDYVRERAGSREQFDLVICDPPAFAKSRGEVDRAARGYKDVNLHAMKLVSPGGHLMTFSCSGHMSLDLFQKVIFSAALDAGRRASFVRRLGAGPDHPVSLYCPEGEYLKGFLVRVE